MFICYDKDMNVMRFPNGVTPLDIFISSIQLRRRKSTIEGVDGYIDFGSEYDTRQMSISLKLDAKDTQDYRLLRDEVFSFFNAHDYFYISETYQKGKRYKVKVSESFIPQRLNRRVASIDIPLELVELPFAESIGRTSDIDQNGISYDDEIWGYGMGLLYDDESQKYTHNTRTFRIYNAGNVPIDPFQQELKITIQGASSGYELRNKTTGDVFRLTENPNSKVILDGPNVTDNGLQALRKTNRKFITLKTGWNEFEQNQNAIVSFDFPFYYL